MAPHTAEQMSKFNTLVARLGSALKAYEYLFKYGTVEYTAVNANLDEITGKGEK